jgi:hypothetical protein
MADKGIVLMHETKRIFQLRAASQNIDFGGKWEEDRIRYVAPRPPHGIGSTANHLGYRIIAAYVYLTVVD